MAVDQIEREILIQAPPDRVWAALTEAEHLAQWFGDSAQIDLRPGGAITFGWSQYQDAVHHATVVRVDPPRFFSYRWARSAGEPVTPRHSTLVEFTLTPDGPDRTRLRVVESGFAHLDATDFERATAVEENTRGWHDELDELTLYLERIPA
jgi:uncharacterized protein YndB with AHSA1/START domain